MWIFSADPGTAGGDTEKTGSDGGSSDRGNPACEAGGSSVCGRFGSGCRYGQCGKYEDGRRDLGISKPGSAEGCRSRTDCRQTGRDRCNGM